VAQLRTSWIGPERIPHAVARQQTTPVGFEPTRGEPIGLAGRRLASPERCDASADCRRELGNYAGSAACRHVCATRAGKVVCALRDPRTRAEADAHEVFIPSEPAISVGSRPLPLRLALLTSLAIFRIRRGGGIEPLHVSMPHELKSCPSTSPTHPGWSRVAHSARHTRACDHSWRATPHDSCGVRTHALAEWRLEPPP
jgi:hypothetical protein